MSDVISLPYEIQTFRVDRNSINKFKVMLNRRDIRDATVKRVLNSLMIGKHFHNTMIVNKKGQSWRLQDGNHRYEAMRQWFVRQSEKAIDVSVHVYDNLSEDEEKELFSLVNSVAKQTTSDMVKQYWENFAFIKHLERNGFPIGVSHKSDASNLALHVLLHPYLTRDNMPYGGAYQGSAFEFVKLIRAWNASSTRLNASGIEAYNEMRAFLSEFITCFGEYSKSNPFWKQCPLYALFKIWHDSKSELNPEKLVSKFKKLNAAVHRELVKDFGGGGAPRGNTERAIKCFLDIMNGTASRDRVFYLTKNKESGKIIRVFGATNFVEE